MPLALIAACAGPVLTPTPALTPAPPLLPTLTPFPPPTPVVTQPTPRPLPPVALGPFCQEVSDSSPPVCGSFLNFWRQHGGLDQFGLPLAGAFGEKSLATGEVQTVQYFERARLEYLWFKPSPNEVALGLLGREMTAGIQDEQPFRRIADPGDGSWLPETGHTLRGPFRAYWQASGGVERHGFAISEEFEESGADDGQVRLVQYFERSRFEDHPEHRGTRYEVQLGSVGKSLSAGIHERDLRKGDADDGPSPRCSSNLIAIVL